MLKVFLTPADIAPTAVTSLVIVLASSRFFTLLFGPAIHSAVMFRSVIEASTLEFRDTQ